MTSTVQLSDVAGRQKAQSCTYSVATCAALLLSGCFGTGVVISTPATTSAVTLSDAILSPPAPTQTQATLVNQTQESVALTAVEVPGDAHVSVDTSACEGYPNLPQKASCILRFAAMGNAVPGLYDVRISYVHQGQVKVATSQLTVMPGPLRINGDVPIELPNQTRQIPVTVANAGFDVGDVNVVVACPAMLNGEVGPCVIDNSECAGGLIANATCTVLLSSANLGYGAVGFVQAGGKSHAQVNLQPIRTGSVTAASLTFQRPETQQIAVRNQGPRPVSVVSITLVGTGISGFSLPQGANGPHPTLCQNFTGTCNVPLTASSSAYITGNSAVIAVAYKDDVMTHTALAALVLNNTTTASCTTNATQLLPASVGHTTVTAVNTGLFDWHDAGAALAPSLSGVSVAVTCQGAVGPGESFDIIATTSNAVPEGAVSSIVLTGDNLAAAPQVPVRVARSVLAVGSDQSGSSVIDVSYDGGASWGLRPLGLVSASWQDAVLVEDRWVVVGTQQSYNCVYTSQDRGHTWTSSPMPNNTSGTLYGVTATAPAGALAAVGDDGFGNAICRTSSDGGASWGYAQSITPSSAIAYDVAYNGQVLVSVGGDGRNGFAVVATDAIAPTWSAGFHAPGNLYHVIWDGQAWLAVGEDGQGNMQVMRNALPSGDDAGWQVVNIMQSPGVLRGVASDGPRVIAVGTDGVSQAVIVSTDGGQNFGPVQIAGPGELRSIVHNSEGYYVAGYQGGAQNMPVILHSPDGANWQAVEHTADGALVGIATH